MKYLYGPVQSRRLGLSLGVSLTPYKICNFNCIYCQLGRTGVFTSERKEYANREEIINELRSYLANNPGGFDSLSYITLSGLGEPTLNVKIKDIIAQIKGLTKTKVAVITNASLFGDPQVRQDLLSADLAVPSLDAVDNKVFSQINRPLPEINIENIISGLISFRKEFKNQLWLEVMLVAGVNDELAQIRRLKEAVEMINPDKIQLNSPVRLTAEDNILPADKNKLKKIKEILGDKCEII
jgi:wyosine [tRNA(Phe)-imidazoG37] synthetase (radical SAM superfamily)